MLRRDRIDDAEPNAHPTLCSGHTKQLARRRNRWSDTVANPKIARAITMVGTLMINLVIAYYDRIAVHDRPDELSILSGIEAIEGPCQSFVCFVAS